MTFVELPFPPLSNDTPMMFFSAKNLPLSELHEFSVSCPACLGCQRWQWEDKTHGIPETELGFADMNSSSSEHDIFKLDFIGCCSY